MDKKISTYISENKFQFITDFSKKQIIIDGKQYEIDFGSLSIPERIMLSSYLTYLCNNGDDINTVPQKNLYNIIFNFNGNKNNRKTSYEQSFLDDLSKFIANNAYMFAYIKMHYKDIIDEKTEIYRQQLNHTEMDLLYSLKFQRNYNSLMNVLYILGVSKQNIPSLALNKIELRDIYSNVTQAKKRIIEIFEKINSVSKKKVKYEFIGTTVSFKPGFKMDENEDFFSDKKKEYLKNEKIKDFLFNNKEEEPEPLYNIKNIYAKTEEETPMEDKQEPVKEETQEDNSLNFDVSKMTIKEALDLGENRPFTMGIFKKLYEKDQEKTGWLGDTFERLKNTLTKHGFEPTDIIRKNIIKFDLDLTSIVKKYENLNMCLSGNKLGDNWKEIKDEARIELESLRNHICKKLSNVYDSDETETKPVYNLIVFYVAISTKKVLTCEI